MNLKETTEKLFKDSKRTPMRGLSAIAEAEKYLQQAYEGRYFFELIQNVRDANKENNQDGAVYITLNNGLLSISNTGAEFSTKGVEGITTIGQSTKRSQDYIGFKGIGFKSIQEVTETPRIITRHGAVHFNRTLTLKAYNDPQLREEQIPLFYFPHFRDERLSEKEIGQGIVTKIELPLREGIALEKITDDFSEIKAKQLILLGNIQTLRFEWGENVSVFSIRKNHQKHAIEVQENDTVSRFKYYTPAGKIEIPGPVIETLGGKEREIFGASAFVDVSVVLELTENGQISPITQAKLYLFYPLQITSGFRFIIHSYFIVNPERTALRESAVNDFLLSSIGKFIGGEMLASLKKTNINTNRVLCFKRNEDAKIEVLYENVVAELKRQKFIYDSRTKKYFGHTEVIVADDFDKGLFPDGVLHNKQLIYIDDTEVRDWLTGEFEVPYLSYERIADHIESECKRQLRQRKVKFFQNLYNYVSKHDKLNLTGKKVLLTDDWKLVSSDEDVFYGGGKRNGIKLSDDIKRKIHFIHKDIKINDFREGRSRTGITEFNTYEVVRRLLKLFGERSIARINLLNALYNMQPFDVKSELEIREKILLPIKGTDKWLSPFTHPIYVENENLRQLYPNGNFVDSDLLIWEGKKEDEISGTEFLKKFGVWDIPAVYLSEKQVAIKPAEKRDKLLGSLSGFSSRPFYIRNDRILHMPEKHNVWFTNTVIDNWHVYELFINHGLMPKLQYSNSYSYWRDAGKDATIKLSRFIEILSAEKWICFSGEDEVYSIGEIVGISSFDYAQAHLQVVRKFLKLLPIDFGVKKGFVEAIGLLHLDARSIGNFEGLLRHIFKRHETGLFQGKEFIDFYNRMLGKLVDFYEANHITEPIIQQLHKLHFLGVDDITKKVYWEVASQIFYIDDKPAYDILPVEIKQRLQPHFTNRDKNTFGKIAGKIGKKFSSSIKKELLETKAHSTGLLISFFKLLPESIALLESHLGDAITKHLDMVKAIKVFEKEELMVKITVGGSPEMMIPVTHFVDSDLNVHLAVQHSGINKHRQLAECLNELFINILERDLRNFNANLLNFLNAGEKNDYLKSYDITEERVSEVRNKLNDSSFSLNQRFWASILSAKGVRSTEDIFIGEQIKIDTLAVILKVDAVAVKEVEDNFDFLQANNHLNIPKLAKLLSLLGIKLQELNEAIFPKIDFRGFYLKELTKLKNSFEKGFNAILYSCLLKKDDAEQCNYQDYLDHYKYGLEFIIPLNTIELNAKKFFLKLLSDTFSFLEVTVDDLQKNFDLFNANTVYLENLRLFKNKLSSAELAGNSIDGFLDDNKRRSLLYFGNVEQLANNFRKWLKEHSTGELSTDKKDNWKDFLSTFSNQTNTEIEQVNTSSIAINTFSNSSTTGGDNRRYDGAMNDEQKQRIGLVAEMVVFEKLKTIYDNVLWVSKNASKIYKTHLGYNPEGRDGLGYDIEYIDNKGNKFFVEVKGRAESHNAFEISKNELDKAHKEEEFYKIILVTQTMKNDQRKIRDLGNIFTLNDGEDFFTNNRFTAIYKNFEIRFK